MARRSESDFCPECGATFRRGRLACPECGSDAQTGWKSENDIQYESVHIPDTYEELVGEVVPRRNPRVVVYWVGAVLALLGMLLFAFLR